MFNASINGTADATILVESGIPALLVDSAYVFSSGILSGMELTVTNKEKLNLAGRVYKITHKANGTVRIGNSTSYVGEVFVLSNYDYGNYEVAVPVMYLHNDLDDGDQELLYVLLAVRIDAKSPVKALILGVIALEY